MGDSYDVTTQVNIEERYVQRSHQSVIIMAPNSHSCSSLNKQTKRRAKQNIDTTRKDKVWLVLKGWQHHPPCLYFQLLQCCPLSCKIYRRFGVSSTLLMRWLAGLNPKVSASRWLFPPSTACRSFPPLGPPATTGSDNHADDTDTQCCEHHRCYLPDSGAWSLGE